MSAPTPIAVPLWTRITVLVLALAQSGILIVAAGLALFSPLFGSQVTPNIMALVYMMLNAGIIKEPGNRTGRAFRQESPLSGHHWRPVAFDTLIGGASLGVPTGIAMIVDPNGYSLVWGIGVLVLSLGVLAVRYRTVRRERKADRQASAA